MRPSARAASIFAITRRPSSASSPCRPPSGGRSRPAPSLARDRRSSSSIASSSRLPSLRMCEMYMPPYWRGGLRERDQLVGLRVERRRVDQRRADAERALLHRLAHQLLHARQLVRRRRAIRLAELVDRAPSSRRRTTRRSATRRGARDIRDIRRAWSTRSSYLMSPCASTISFFIGVVQRAHRPAFAEHLERDALPDVALRRGRRRSATRRPSSAC